MLTNSERGVAAGGCRIPTSRARNLRPDIERASPEFPVRTRPHQMSSVAEEIADARVQREETLSAISRSEPAHLAFTLARRPMGDLGTVVGELARVIAYTMTVDSCGNR